MLSSLNFQIFRSIPFILLTFFAWSFNNNKKKMFSYLVNVPAFLDPDVLYLLQDRA